MIRPRRLNKWFPVASSARSVLQVLSLLLAGITIGAGGSILIVNASSAVYERAMVVAVVVGFVLFMLFVLLRTVLATIFKKTIGEPHIYESAARGVAQPFIDLAKRHGTLDEQSEAAIHGALKRLTSGTQSALQLASAYIGAAGAMALAVGIVGAVISMAAVVAANRQVDRMTSQNSLIEQQIFEATATRISQVFAAQLPSLLDAIEASRRASFSIEGDPKQEKSWIVEQELIARIQALIYATQPYAPDLEIEALHSDWLEAEKQLQEPGVGARANTQPAYAKAVYSPERGQLLSILVAAQFPFASLERPLDFSAADLRNIPLGRRTVVGPSLPFDLGETIIRNSNLRNSQLSSLDLSKTDLSGAVLPDLRQSSQVVLWEPANLPSNDARRIKWLSDYPRLHNTVIEVADPNLTDPYEYVNPGRWDHAVSGRFVRLTERRGYRRAVESFTVLMSTLQHDYVDIRSCNASELPEFGWFKDAYLASSSEVTDRRFYVSYVLQSLLKEYEKRYADCATKTILTVFPNFLDAPPEQ